MPIADIMATPQLRQNRDRLQREHAAAQAQVRETQSILGELQSDLQEVLDILQYYAQKMVDAYEDYDEITAVLEDLEIRRAEVAAELVTARANLVHQDDLFRERLRAMHEQGTAGYLEVLLHATSFSDFLLRLEHVRSIAQSDQYILEGLHAAEEYVTQKADELDRINVLFKMLQVQQQDAIDALAEAEAAHNRMLKHLQENEAMVEALLALEMDAENALRAEFGIAERALQTHIAEEQRRQQEAARLQRQQQQNARLAHLNSPNGDWQWPLPARSHISSPFGNRTHPISGRNEFHSGIDIPAPAGSRIVAAADGVVRLAGWHGGFGLTVIIDHGGGYSTLYAHNSRNRVSVGQHVNRGDHIADVGTTGVSTGNHLHFEIRRNGTPINPMQFW